MGSTASTITAEPSTTQSAPAKPLNMWWWWLGLVFKHKPALAVGIASLGVVLVADALTPWIVGLAIDKVLTQDVVDGAQVSLPILGTLDGASALFCILGAGLVMLLVRDICQFKRDDTFNLIGEKVHLDLRQQVFDHLQRLPMSFFDQAYTGRIMARITTDADALYHLLNQGTFAIIGQGLLIVVVGCLLMSMHVGLTLCLGISIPVLAWFAMRTRTRAKAAGRDQRDALAGLYSRLQERIGGIRVIRSLGRNNEESDAFRDDLRLLYGHNRRLVRGYAALGAVSNGCAGVTRMLVLAVGGLAVLDGQLSVGALVTFYLSANLLLQPMTQLIAAWTHYVTDATVALERLGEVLEQSAGDDGGTIDDHVLGGAIRIDQLDFSYVPGRPVLRDINIAVEPGQSIALVGHSGSGKSTLVDLLSRFYRPDRGSISCDGIDISDLEPGSYRRQIGYVSQDTFLFAGSVADNLRIARPKASDADLIEAARQANALGFINDLPDGFATQIGERGVQLSGGQRQRLGIARTLLSDPRVLILDEPTSALDAESEAVVMDAVRRCFAGRTCIIIAHRLATVRHCDRIHVLHDGAIVETGRHHELCSQDGIYRDLAAKQGLIADEHASHADRRQVRA